MSLVCSDLNDSSKSSSSNSSCSELQSEQPSRNSQGFSSSLVLKFDEDSGRAKPSSKLVSITQLRPGCKKVRQVMMPVFYRKQFSSTAVGQVEAMRCELRRSGSKQGKKVTSTTFASLHNFSHLDGESNNEIFFDKANFNYEKDLKSSIHQGNFIAYCHKCGKETVCLVQVEKTKGIMDWILCCCSSWNVKPKNWVCPTCFDILIKTN